MKMNGSEIVIECLREQGVDTVFGYPGGAILNIYDELYKHSDEIKHILTSHEQGAAHAADGYARATGKVGVCFATSGPGATNLVTGIATAFMDSVPLVAITCNVGKSLLGKDSFQEIDIKGVTLPITKYNFIVQSIQELPFTIRKAFSIARTGRPGPVLIDILKDVTAAEMDFIPAKIDTQDKHYPVVNEIEIENAAKLIDESKKPVVFIGGGANISGASDEIKEFVEKIDASVCDSLMGKGAFDGTSERYTGMLGMHGTKTSNFSVMNADLLVAVGTRFSDRVTGNTKTFAKNAKIIHIDIDAAEIDKNVRCDESIIGDVKDVMAKLSAAVKKNSHPEWMQQIAKWKEEYPLKYKDGFSGPAIMQEIYSQTKGDATIVTEVGQHQMWAAQYYKYKYPRTLITSGGLGTMGYGLGAAIGAKIGRPDSHVINIAGDGCFRMNMNELATAARNNIPVIEIVMDNRVLGMVHQWQQLFYGERFSNTVFTDKVDYVKLADALGAKGLRATNIDEFKACLKEALESKDVPVLIDCMIPSGDNVWPMVAPGASISDAFDDKDVAAKQK